MKKKIIHLFFFNFLNDISEKKGERIFFQYILKNVIFKKDTFFDILLQPRAC